MTYIEEQATTMRDTPPNGTEIQLRSHSESPPSAGSQDWPQSLSGVSLFENAVRLRFFLWTLRRYISAGVPNHSICLCRSAR